MRYLILFLFIPFVCFAETVRIDEDTIEIREIKTIKISDLESQLEEMEFINNCVEEDEAWIKTLDKDKQELVVRMPIQDTQELEEKISEYKEMPIDGIAEFPISR